jgi:AraC-like DNA-binding protein
MAQRERFRSTGAEAVEETWRRVVPSARLRRLDPLKSEFEWASSDIGGVTVVAYELDATVRSAVQPEGQLMVCRVSAPEGGAWDDEGPLDGRLPWATSANPINARWAGRGRVHALVFDLEMLKQSAREITGVDQLPGSTWAVRPQSEAAARQWQRTYRYLAESLLTDDASGLGLLLESELRRHAVYATLAAFSPDFLDAADRTAQTRAAPAAVRRALAYIEAHAHEPLIIDDVARAARMSTRGLQYAFRRALDTTPTDWIRRARLAGAHHDLSDPEGGSVADIARRWGFEHPSRFAAHYRAQYGVNPSRTARANR